MVKIVCVCFLFSFIYASFVEMKTKTFCACFAYVLKASQGRHFMPSGRKMRRSSSLGLSPYRRSRLKLSLLLYRPRFSYWQHNACKSVMRMYRIIHEIVLSGFACSPCWSTYLSILWSREESARWSWPLFVGYFYGARVGSFTSQEEKKKKREGLK